MESAPVFANDFGRYLYIFYWPPAEPLSGAHGTLRSHGTPQLKITGLDDGCCVFPNNAPGLKLPSWYTRSSTAVHRHTLAHSLDVADFQVAEGFALPEATASSSLRFTAPLLAAEHFRLLAPKCGTACHRRLRRHRLWRPSAFDSVLFCSPSHILTF